MDKECKMTVIFEHARHCIGKMTKTLVVTEEGKKRERNLS